jgi:biotin transport system substrate-specific component
VASAKNVTFPLELMWALIGLLLTIAGTFIEASMIGPPWDWDSQGISIFSLGVTYQIGAVLLIGCLAGKKAGTLSQIAYLSLGLLWLPVFSQGGGWTYLKEPSIGYLLGFVPGAWVCGTLAFRKRLRLEYLALSCIGGLLVIHLVGISYLIVSHYFIDVPLVPQIVKYSVAPLLGHLVIVCEVTVLAFMLRKFLFY